MIDFSAAMVIAAIAGFLFGLTYFTWLWRSVSSLATAKRAPLALLLGAILRFAMLAAVVGVLLWLKIAPLLLLFGGLGFSRSPSGSDDRSCSTGKGVLTP